jgi:hypothetical protein
MLVVASMGAWLALDEQVTVVALAHGWWSFLP